jgi:hypothetical protein
MRFSYGISICAIAVLQIAAGQQLETEQAASCIGRFVSAPKNCGSISAFAHCVALTKSSDSFRANAEKLLAESQVDIPDCDLKVTPSIKVVDRELRVVTQKDVKFQRFRRDEVGVFELKEMIDANTDRIAATSGLNAAITTLTDSAKDTTMTLDAKIDAVDSKCDGALLAANAKITSNEAEITKLQASIKTVNEEAEKASAVAVEVAASWQFVGNPIHPTHRREAVGIRVVGKNFEQYDYTPDVAPFFECTFTLTSDTSNKVVTKGKTLRAETATDPSFVVSCPSPVSIVSKSTFKLSLSWTGGAKAVAIPYNGAEGKDNVKFDMTWTALKETNGRVIVDVSGLSVAGKYVCVFTQPDNANIRKTADARFLDEGGRQLDCGPQPAGFAITGNTARVIFEIMVKGTRNKASYAGPEGAGPIVSFNSCFNGVKDGEETDKDCGGLCSGCKGGATCKKDNDCEGDILCTSKGTCVDNDGSSAAASGESCASILKVHPKSASGLKWINPDKSDKGPFQVYCDQEHDGGGWTLLNHLSKGSNYPCNDQAYKQSWSKWESNGIGNVKMLENMNADTVLTADKCVWLPFEKWGRIVGNSPTRQAPRQTGKNTLKLVGQKGFGSAVTLNDFYVDGRERFLYGLRMSNYNDIKRRMCGNNDNCFASPNVGFSTGDRDRDSYSGHCSTHYGNVGWWQAHCHHHHQTAPGVSQNEFGGCQGAGSGNCNTKKWSWYVR